LAQADRVDGTIDAVIKIGLDMPPALRVAAAFAELARAL
jgi:hypothetical protein